MDAIRGLVKAFGGDAKALYRVCKGIDPKDQPTKTTQEEEKIETKESEAKTTQRGVRQPQKEAAVPEPDEILSHEGQIAKDMFDEEEEEVVED